MENHVYTVQNLQAHNGRPKALSEFIPVNSQHYKQHLLSAKYSGNKDETSFI